MSVLEEYKKKLSSSKIKRDWFLEKSEAVDKEISQFRKSLISLEEAQIFLQDVAQQTQSQLRFHIRDIVQLCLDSVWEGEVEFDLIYEIKRGKTEARLVFMVDGEEVNPLEQDGGGLVHLAAFALRIAVWTLGNTRNTIVLDEPLGALQPKELQLQGFRMIKELSEKLGLQFIIVKNSVNSDDLQDIADKVFKVSRKRKNDWWQSEVEVYENF